MMDIEQVRAFVMYNYIPFKKSQCIKRILMIWVASLILCFIGKPSVLWALMFGIADLFLSLLFIYLIIKHSQSQISRYLCDGFFFLYISVLLNLASYRVMAIAYGANWVIALIRMAFLMVCILFSILLTFSNIKSGKFSESNPSNKLAFLPVFFGAFGILTARVSLQGASQQAALGLLSYILFVLSLITSMISVLLLKALFYKRYF